MKKGLMIIAAAFMLVGCRNVKTEIPMKRVPQVEILQGVVKELKVKRSGNWVDVECPERFNGTIPAIIESKVKVGDVVRFWSEIYQEPGIDYGQSRYRAELLKAK